MIGGARPNESQYAWTKLAKGVLGTDHVDAQLGDGLPAEAVLGLPRATINQACAPGGTVILVGPDPKEDLGALFLRLRHAVVNDGTTLIELTPTRTGLSTIAAHSLHPKPGEVDLLAAALVDAVSGDARDAAGVPADAIAAAAAAISGPVTVVLGRASVAESARSPSMQPSPSTDSKASVSCRRCVAAMCTAPSTWVWPRACSPAECR